MEQKKSASPVGVKNNIGKIFSEGYNRKMAELVVVSELFDIMEEFNTINDLSKNKEKNKDKINDILDGVEKKLDDLILLTRVAK